MVTIPELVGKKTKKKTTAGRDVYKTLRQIGPVPKGSSVSELGVSIPLNKKKTRWLNAPSIYHGVQYTDDEILRFYKQGQLKSSEIEIIEGSVEDAVRASQKRSSKLLKRKKGGPPKPKRKPTIAERFPPRRKPSRVTKKPYHYSKGALEKELERIMEKSSWKPDPVVVTEKKKSPYEQSFEKLRQKYIDKAAKLDLGEEVDEAVWADVPDDTRSLALLNLLKPYLKDNPMAQLGFDVIGGGEGIMKLFIDSMKNMPEWGMQIPKAGFTTPYADDRRRRAALSREHKKQNIEALTGFKDPLQEFHSSGKKRPFIMYRDAVGTEWPEEDAVATNIDRQIKQGLATLMHELGHAGDDYLRSESGTRLLGERFQQALALRRAEKFKEGPHKLPELRKGPTATDVAGHLKWRKKYSRKYPRPYEHPYMDLSLKTLLDRLGTSQIPRPKRKPKK